MLVQPDTDVHVFDDKDEFWQLYRSANVTGAMIDLVGKIEEYQNSQSNFETLRKKAVREEGKLTEIEILTLI